MQAEELREARLTAANTILAKDPNISIRPFASRIAMMTHATIDTGTAWNIMTELTGRRPRSKTADAARNAAEAQQANN